MRRWVLQRPIKTPKLYYFYDIQNKDTQKSLLEISIPMKNFGWIKKQLI